jgi:tetratricopeptide (TPR) repeat protein
VVDAPVTGGEIGSIAGRATVEEFWQTWPKVRGGPREGEFFGIWFRLAATIANLWEEDEIRTLARSFMNRECPDESPWAPGSDVFKAAASKFGESLGKEREMLAEHRKSRLNDWCAALTLALESDEEDENPPPKEAREFLKKGFDAGAIEAERTRHGPRDPAEVFRVESTFWTPVVYLQRGQQAQIRGDHDRAIVQFSVALRVWPRLAGAYVNRGYARGKKGDPDGAIEDYSRAIEIDPRTRKALYYRAWAWERKGKTDLAVEDFTKAIDQDPRDKGALVGRGQCLIDKKDHAGAIRDFSKALELDPEDSSTYVWRGYVRRLMGDETLAEEDFSRAIDEDPKNAEAYYRRGAVRKVGSPDKAIQDLEKALELAPKDWYLRDLTEKLLRELKKQTEPRSK